MSKQTRILTDLPPSVKPIRCKWVFNKKLNIDGYTNKFKARLVAKGYKQRQRVDRFDTYAPIARITSIRC